MNFDYILNFLKQSDNFFIFLMFIGNGTMTFILAFLWKDQTTLKGLGEISYIVLLSAFISGLFGNASTLVQKKVFCTRIHLFLLFKKELFYFLLQEIIKDS